VAEGLEIEKKLLKTENWLKSLEHLNKKLGMQKKKIWRRALYIKKN
jgi:hypothetical protein